MSNSDEIRLAEFTALRQETGQRAALQQAIIALNITVAGLITGFVVSDRADQALFVVVSFTAGVLGLLWIDHHLSIHQIAAYVRDELWQWEPSWEKYARRHNKPFLWRVIYVGLMALIFVGVSVTGLVLSGDDIHGSLRAIWWFGALLSALLIGSFAVVMFSGEGKVK